MHSKREVKNSLVLIKEMMNEITTTTNYSICDCGKLLLHFISFK